MGGRLNSARQLTFTSCLGRGGFGEVYRAKLEVSGGLVQDVAVKVLRSDLEMREDAVRRLRDEGRLLGMLSHPAIPRAVDMLRLDGRVALITEFVDGSDLSEAVDSGDPPNTRALLQTLAQVASALEAALSTPGPGGRPLSLVHRDVKPENIRLGRHGDAKLLDFGIAWSASSQREARTATGLVVGSLPWMAPERFTQPRCTSAADVFALGSVFFSAVSGLTLYGETAMPKVAAIATDTLRYREHMGRQLESLDTSVPAPVLDLIDEMVAFHPSDRPSIGQVAERLEALADGLAGNTLRTWARRHSWPEPRDLGGELVGRTLRGLSLDAVPVVGPPPVPARLVAQNKPSITKAPLATLDSTGTRWEKTPVASSRRSAPTLAPLAESQGWPVMPTPAMPKTRRPAPPPSGVYLDPARGRDITAPPLAAESPLEGQRPAPTERPYRPLTDSDLTRTPLRAPGRSGQGRPSAVPTMLEESGRPSSVPTSLESGSAGIRRPSTVATLLDIGATSDPRAATVLTRRPSLPPEEKGVSPVMAGMAVFVVVLIAGILVAVGVLGGAMLAGQ